LEDEWNVEFQADSIGVSRSPQLGASYKWRTIDFEMRRPFLVGALKGKIYRTMARNRTHEGKKVLTHLDENIQ
jgi:hypothetical protein